MQAPFARVGSTSNDGSVLRRVTGKVAVRLISRKNMATSFAAFSGKAQICGIAHFRLLSHNPDRFSTSSKRTCFLAASVSLPEEVAAPKLREVRGLQADNSWFPGPVLVVILVAGAVIAPFLWLGIASGHDFEFHLNSWMEVAGRWGHGDLNPCWAAAAQYGYGEPRFIFYPPASWMLGAALGTLLPWVAVPAAYLWIALTLSGCAMFALTRRWFSRRDAMFAAALYTANPYFIVLVYWRSAYAELLAGALLPLLLMYVLQAREDGRRVILPLGLIVAAAWLTNAPAAVMLCYSLALLSMVIAITQRFPRVLIFSAGAVLLGAALAAFYLIPAVYEQEWVNIGQVLAPGLRPQDNFLFTTVADPDHSRFNLLISVIATVEIAVVALAALLSSRWRIRSPRFWWTTVAWAGAASWLMFSGTAFLWRHLPELRFLQLPWRWLLCLNLPLVFLVLMAWRRWSVRASVWAALLATLLFVWHDVQAPWWEKPEDIARMMSAQRSGVGYEGTDEYTPAFADAYDVKPDAALVTAEDGASLQVRVLQWDAESKLFMVESRRPTRLLLRLFNYPAWQATVNGALVDAETEDNTGQMIVPVAAGTHQVRVSFVKTRDRKAGELISGVTFGLLAGFFLFKRRRRRAPRKL